MRVNIFIRKENEDKWNNITNKSRWVNTILANSDDTSSYGAIKDTPIGPVVAVLSEDLEEDMYKNLIYEVAVGAVWDTTTGEQVEADQDVINILQKRQQVR